MQNFQFLLQTLQPSIFSWDYFSDFKKIRTNSLKTKIQLNILNSLLGDDNIEFNFLELVKTYPETREILPILIAVRDFDKQILDRDTLDVEKVIHLFNKNQEFNDKDMLCFFKKSGLQEVFQCKNISNLNDYVFGVEVGLDSNARKNRTGDLMEDIVEVFVKDLCEKNPGFEYKEQATANFIKKEWGINVESDKSSRRFDFAIFDRNRNKVFLLEVNYYGGPGSKLKAVAGEFAGLYNFMKKQDIPFVWITDGIGWYTTERGLEEAYVKMEGNIYNIEMLKSGILNEITR